MSAIAGKLDPKKYGRLLARTLPKAIETEGENERALAVIERLMDRAGRRSPEESALLKLLLKLVQDFETAAYPIPNATGREVLLHLMEARGLRQRDLLPVFDSSGITSEVVSGKRAISKTHARKLSEFFHVPADLFIT
ncbi:MAG TPA: transcriptional regulator [Blastocatellia bacterium]|nr:transcriptional regulator [Blastocatellia bacterium]